MPLPPAPPPRIPRAWWGWLVVLYAASGFPFGLFKKTVPIYLARIGVAKDDIGLLSLLALPWTLKFLWAPVVDRYGTRRAWAAGGQMLLALCVVGFALSATTAPLPWWAWAALVGIALFSATQDIAIDAWGVEAFPGPAVGNASGIRVNAYRVSYLVAGGLLLSLTGWIGWAGVWATAAAILVLLAAASAHAPVVPRVPRVQGENPVVAPFRQLFARPGFAVVGAFVLLFKLGDYALAPMTDQFLVRKDGANWSDATIALATTVGVAVTIAGALLGGWLTTKWGVFRALWILGLLQAVSNLAYAGAAAAPGPATAWTAAVVEPFCGGLGTAPYLALLMVSCDRAHAGTQYALLSALFALSREAAGTVSGFGAAAFGYAGYFTLTFAAALPAFALLPWVRRWLQARERDASAASPAAAPAD